MSSDKNLKDIVTALKSRLETLERGDFGKQIEELRRENHEIEKAHQKTIEGLRKQNSKLASRLSKLLVVAAGVFVMLTAIAVYYVEQYHKLVEQNDENRPEVLEILMDVFQNKLGDTIDRISLLAPGDEDKVMVKEVNDMQDQLNKICASSKRCVELSKLTKALKQVVNEGKAQDASTQLNTDALPSSSDRFVASRALLLQAAANSSKGLCGQPDATLKLITQASEKDSGLVAALNLKGVCLAQESQDLLANGPEALMKNPDLWKQSVEKIRASLRNNKFAYEFKPSQWSKTRFLNNKAWNSMQFLSAALRLNPEKLAEALQQIGDFKDMEAFFEYSLGDLKECALLSNGLAIYLESEADLHALELAYYTDNKYKDDGKAKLARDSMIGKIAQAFDKGLLRIRGLSDWKNAEEYFMADPLLNPHLADPEIYRAIKDLVEQRLRRNK